MKVSKHIEELMPYVPGKPIEETKREYGLDHIVKLASNESPIGVSDKVKQTIKNHINELNRYPDPSCFKLKQTVAKYLNLQTENLTFGNGSNELIDLLIRIFCKPGEKVMTSKGAFIAYKVCAQAARADFIEVPLTEDLRFDVKAIVKAVKQHQPKILFIANPNNPTGTYITEAEFTYLMQHLKKEENTLVVFDEAYNEFVRAKDYPQVTRTLSDYKNLVVIKTFSKVFGLAGLRIGAVAASPDVIALVDKVRNPFNVNTLAQVATITALEDEDYVNKARQVNWEGLDYFYNKLDQMGIKYWSSETNFILFDTHKDSSEVYEQLLKQGIILRPVKEYGFNTHLRMSVGTMDENKQAIQALKTVLK